VQARWLQQAAYLAWRDPRVECLMQYVWMDEPLLPRGLGPKAFAGWQSGLMYADGRPKPALSVFRKPFWIDVTPGRALALFWGQVRPSGAHTVTLLGRSGNGRPWIRISDVATDANGYWTLRLPIYRSGQFRYTFEVPSGDPYLGPITERSAILHVRARVGVLPPPG
jgi:hypothetical protein